MKTSHLRTLSQIFFVGFIAFVGLRHQIVGGGPNGAPPLDTYCVFGGIETMGSYLTTGQFLQKTNWSNLILLLSSLSLALLAGASFCGWICPFGAIQKWLHKLGRVITGKSFEVPSKYHTYLRHFRFVMLFAIVYFTVQGSRLVFEEYDPFKVLFHFNFETYTSYAILIISIIISLLIDRAWCKYLCPLGAVFSVVGKPGIIKVHRDPDACIDCGKCNKACHMHINVQQEKTMPSSECWMCLECMEACPKKDVLTLQIGGAK